MRFVCKWTAKGVGESTLGLDAQLVLDAAERASAILA
jgi:hypothetical protein